MTIYTRTGDLGETGLPGGIRMPKDAATLEAVGTIDELNSLLGLIRAESLPEDIDRLIERLQCELFSMAADLAAGDSTADRPGRIGVDKVRQLEEAIDRHEEVLRPLREFILPAGTRAAAGLHVARTVCRRAERRLVTLVRAGNAPRAAGSLVYLNRLGDLLFVLARAANAAAGRQDVPWREET